MLSVPRSAQCAVKIVVTLAAVSEVASAARLAYCARWGAARSPGSALAADCSLIMNQMEGRAGQAALAPLGSLRQTKPAPRRKTKQSTAKTQRVVGMMQGCTRTFSHPPAADLGQRRKTMCVCRALNVFLVCYFNKPFLPLARYCCVETLSPPVFLIMDESP